MRLKDDNGPARDLTASQAAQLLREGRLGGLLVDRAAGQTLRHRTALSRLAPDQADRLRSAVRALQRGDSCARGGSPEAAA